ncbi:hypothetical protein U9M48_005106 [Paspalum notatum var. saurae]|uniref:Protein kinase domain-containing protein n=1 Tax=Paspalum notatum var. saurae TaxID=547442 RepID=A0AAQ3PL52_PASNO
MEHRDLTFQLLEQITHKFSEERRLGHGTFGTVYRGTYKNGEEIAVKMLRDKDIELDDTRFKDEFDKLRILSHPNIVQLIGYCDETLHEYIEYKGVPVFAEKKHRALCFEYLHKGSLQNHLCDECHGLDWHTRYNIIKGTCEGLKYLHTGLENPICHLDLKPGNILLDRNMVPKLADFGLSKILEPTRSTEGLHGTLGYMPPEYVGKGIRSTKFDIFSLGVVILEIIAGATARTRIDDKPLHDEFTGLVKTNWRMRLQKSWRGSSLEAYCLQVNTCMDIALKCMESDKDKRPHIANVVQQLDVIEKEITKNVPLCVQSVELQFHSDPMDLKISSSLLRLTNNTTSPVAFRLQTMDSEYLLRPLGGMVPPMSSCSLAVTMSHQKPLENSNGNLITLESIIADNQGMQYTTFDAAENYISFSTEAQKDGRVVQEVKLMASYIASPVSGNDMAEMVKEMKNNTSQQQGFTLSAGPSSNDLEFDDVRETSSDVIEELIVGRIEEKEKIIASLVQCDNMTHNITILPIHGIGGIGKTTFAKMIYNDTKFKYYSQVWVYVSPRFNSNKIGNSIISQLSGEVSQLNQKQMIRIRLKKLLAGKKTLIVLDDLWENHTDKLLDLKTMLMLGGTGNTIVIVTTRDENIAKEIGTIEPYKIELLTRELCWDIIKQKSNFEARVDKEQLKDIGMEIASKCGGVPLAAQSLGYTLRFKDLNQWEEVNESSVWNEPNSMDGFLQNQVLAALTLSYSSMDSSLRSCFTYCAIFPKGQDIVRDSLSHQWISLGFIRPMKASFKKHQLSEKYIAQLMGMSFLQPSMSQQTSVAYYEDITLFTMHDLVHDFAGLKLEDKILDTSKKGSTRGSTCQYALLTDCSKPLGLSLTCPRYLRALRFLDCGKIELCGDAFSSAAYLCILDLSECRINQLPDSIGHLQHLKYLNAPGIRGKFIPNNITRLLKLKYLSIRGSAELLALPESIREMEELVHLDLSGCSKIRKLPEFFGKLKNMEHLDLSKCSDVTGLSEQLVGLVKLEHLDVSYCKNIGILPRVLSSLTELQYLNLSFSSYLMGIQDTFLWNNEEWYTKFPEENLSNPFEHQIVGTVEAEILGTLTKVKCLKLCIDGFTTALLPKVPESLGSFTELKCLDLSGSFSLHKLPASMGKLRSLLHLDLSDCYHVEGVPEALAGLSKLKYLNLRYCSSAPNKQLQNLRGLQEAICNLTELRYLNLHGCLRTMYGDHQVDESNVFLGHISTLSNLEHLILSQNGNLYSLPETFGKLRKLHMLDLSNCGNLRKLPVSISEISSLKFVKTTQCRSFDESTLPQSRNNSVVLPHFMVLADDSEPSSNLINLKDEDPIILDISRLERVKSSAEAQRIKLSEKTRIEEIKFEWTKDAERFVEDIEVLEELMPPPFLEYFVLQGYNSIRFPPWVMSIASCLPRVVSITLTELPNCKTLPPLGQLANLQELHIEQMDSITKIDEDFYGCVEAFPKLATFRLFRMESLEEWNTAYPCGDEDGSHLLVFPVLTLLEIRDNPKLRIKPCLPRGEYYMDVRSCYDVLLPFNESCQQIPASSYPAPKGLFIHYSKQAVHEWGLLHQVPGLSYLSIERCSDLTCSSTETVRGLSSSLKTLSVRDCESITVLPEWLGKLTSLMRLEIINITGIQTLPKSIQQLSSLEELMVSGCPDLVWWCESEKLCIEHCSDLICSSTDIADTRGLSSLEILSVYDCKSITALPDWFGDLTSLESLEIINCNGIQTLPGSIQLLTNLQELHVLGCPDLVHWCNNSDNSETLARIKTKELDAAPHIWK